MNDAFTHSLEGSYEDEKINKHIYEFRKNQEFVKLKNQEFNKDCNYQENWVN